MRILFTIPHYFGHTADPNYGSERTDAELRARVIRQCVASLWQTFSAGQGLMDGNRSAIVPANPRLSATITIAVCTTGEYHLASELYGLEVEHVRTNAEPRHLGFECHQVLRSGLGQYDYFAYLEDDLRIADGMFFDKLGWFSGRLGADAVLQPNRFELLDSPAPYKLYIDGNMHEGVARVPQPAIAQHRRIEVPMFGQGLVFQRIDNVHSGCFFLNAAQMARWAAVPDFGVPSAAFCGPLESAATLGLLQHFRVYKPGRENAAFLEIEHLDTRYLGRRFWPVAGNPPTLPWT